MVLMIESAPFNLWFVFVVFYVFLYCSIRHEKVMHIHCLQVSISKYPNFINTEHYLFEMSALLLGLL